MRQRDYQSRISAFVRAMQNAPVPQDSAAADQLLNRLYLGENGLASVRIPQLNDEYVDKF